MGGPLRPLQREAPQVQAGALMDVMSVQDAAFLHIENGNNPMHIGSVAVLEGPAPAYGDLVRLIAGKLPLVPRYRQKVRFAPGGVGRPVWVDDPHFQILYHIRHTAVPPPGGRDELRNLAGRVFAQMLDRTKPLWEIWMVEGLRHGRWAVISKVHHCMVDGVSATDLLTVMFDSAAASPAPPPAVEWTPEPEPGTLTVTSHAVLRTVGDPLGRLRDFSGSLRITAGPRTRLAEGAVLLRSLAEWSKRSATSLNGPIGPHRRWSWAEAGLDDVKIVRDALGGTVNDVVLAAITAGFRALLLHRGEDMTNRVVRTLVPVSVRSDSERGTYNNRVSGIFPGLPVSIADPGERLDCDRRTAVHAQGIEAGRRRRCPGQARRFRTADAAVARRTARGADAAARAANGHDQRSRATVSALRGWPPDGLLVPVRADHGKRPHQHCDLFVLRAALLRYHR